MSNQTYRDPNRGFVLFLLMTFILLMMTICSKILYPAQDSKSSRFGHWWKAIVQVIYRNDYVGTGFFISKDGIIATSLHLAPGFLELAKDNLHVRIDKEFYKAKVVFCKDGAIDLMLLEIKYKPQVWFDQFRHPKIWEKCFVLGYPGGWSSPLETIVIYHQDFDLLGIQAQITGGASGSVVLGEDGAVLGIICKRDPKYGNGIFVPSLYIKDGLERLKDARE